MPVKEWHDKLIIKKVLDIQERRMRLATQVVIGNVKRLINRGNITGKDPSAPGEPPKKVTARLFNSITDEVVRTDTEVIGAVGTNVDYARRLEKGFVGRDSLGRIYDQAPRPFLAPGLHKSLEQVRRILVGER